jgi:hypothetical protein
MSSEAPLAVRAETRWTMTVDRHGQPREATDAPGVETAAVALATAAAADELAVAGAAAQLGELELWVVRGATELALIAVRGDALLLVAAPPTKGTVALEKALHDWRLAAPVSPVPAPLPAGASRADPSPELERAWADLRRTLARGQLTDASACFREVARAMADGGAETAELERASSRLLQGIGSVFAGDGVAGLETLADLTANTSPIPSLRWAALQWSAWAAIRSGRAPLAMDHVSAALEVAEQLDAEALAVSQLTAADIVAICGDSSGSLAWLAEARSRFETLGDVWGVGQSWLHEARVHVAFGREAEAEVAARNGWAARPDWAEPPLFLARRALVRGEHSAATELVRALATPAADRIRALIETVRAGIASQPDVSAFLEVQEAPMCLDSIRSLVGLTTRVPRFLQAREALGWMLLKRGRYTHAGAIFRGLLACELTQGDRTSVSLGLGCVTQALQRRGSAGEGLSAAIDGGQATLGPTGDLDFVLGAGTGRVETGNGPDAVFSGQLSLFPVPDVLEFLRTARRSGVLACSSESASALLRFRGGAITGATCTGVPRTGDLLVAAKKLSRETLASLTGPVGLDGIDDAICETLVREGSVDAASVRTALSRQVELAVRSLVEWKNGEFSFSHSGLSEAADSECAIELDPQALLLDVFRQLDEGTRDLAAGSMP